MYSVMIVFETPRPCNVLSDHFGRRRSRQPCPYRMVISILEAHLRNFAYFLCSKERRENNMLHLKVAFGKGGDAGSIRHVNPLFSPRFSEMWEEKKGRPAIKASGWYFGQPNT